MSVVSSLIHVGHGQDSAADVFVFPSQIKKTNHQRGHSRSRAQNFTQPTVASICKGQRLSNIQMTGCMLVDLAQDARKRGSAIFSLSNGKHGRNAVVQCTQVIIEWLDKSGANGASYSNKAAKSVSGFAVGRANGTEHREEGERPNSVTY